MKRHFRQKIRPLQVPGAGVLIPPLALLVLLLCALAPLSAQTRTEEWVDTGRFGAEEPEESGAERKDDINDQWLRLGLRTGPSLRIYTPSRDTRYTGGDNHAASLDLAFQANLRLLPFLSVQAEAVFTWDNASLWAYDSHSIRYTKDYTAFSLQFPLLVKLDLYPGIFKVSPFMGLYFITPLGRLRVSDSLGGGGQTLSYRFSPPLGFVGGLSGSLKMGPGALIADLRYAADFGDIKAKNGSTEEFRRSMISLTIGYELGFLARKGGAHD